MILELDCGNSFIKWRVISAVSQVRAGGVVGSDEELLAHLAAHPALHPTQCRLVSVRSEEETARLTEALKASFSLNSEVARPAKVQAGVTNGYDDYQRLGLDRWVAVLGAYKLAARACVVIDLGTAVTSDFVSAQGIHLGGFICPGLSLMRNQLRTHTRRIRYDDYSAEQAKLTLLPGHSTVEAVERGCVLMLRGFVSTQLEHAAACWGHDYSLFLTGGDAALISEAFPQAQIVPDLVFQGLAIACPLT
ncbi:pantothenate kinase [Pseudomonas sp. RIT-PI-S]|uniref:pantothenate kinase n=1 Tax=Pseudomonas sp. RIT-PI-S TaxID=3035295 RepID=UPI0021D8D670|nr:pantothenate kinase [Pseudomonas sp. RIT-PI-S]